MMAAVKDAVLRSYKVNVSYADASGAEQKSTLRMMVMHHAGTTGAEAATTVEGGKMFPLQRNSDYRC